MDFRLDNIRRDRPTIPYKQFPRPNLETYQSTSYSHSRDNSPDARADMDASSSTTGHRRRRSTLLNAVDPGKGKSSQKDRGIDEAKWEDDDEPWSGDDSRSVSEELEDEDDEGSEDEEAGLTGADRKQKHARRRRNTLLDQRIVGDSKLTAQEKKEADQNVAKNLLINGVLIGLW